MAAGLPELVTESAEDYEAKAVTLAKDTKLLGALRDRLKANRATCELFDTDLFRRRIEAAYDTDVAALAGGRTATGLCRNGGLKTDYRMN